MLFLDEVNIDNYWYMPVILGIYLFVPFVATALQHFDTRIIMIPLVIASCFVFGVSLANVVLETLGAETLSAQLSLEFGGGVYGILVIVGYLFKKGAFNGVKKGWFAAALVGGLSAAIALQLWTISNDYFYAVWYDNPFICLTSWGLFGLVQGTDTVPLAGVVERLSTSSFGIYLVHLPLMYVFILKLGFVHRSVGVFVMFLLSLVISWAIVELINLIPGTGKVLFYIKRSKKRQDKT